MNMTIIGQEPLKSLLEDLSLYSSVYCIPHPCINIILWLSTLQLTPYQTLKSLYSGGGVSELMKKKYFGSEFHLLMLSEYIYHHI